MQLRNEDASEAHESQGKSLHVEFERAMRLFQRLAS